LGFGGGEWAVLGGGEWTFWLKHLCSLSCSLPRRFGEMPLSQLQLEALKNPAPVIQIQEANPKKPGSKAIGDATAKGATKIGRTSRVILKKKIEDS